MSATIHLTTPISQYIKDILDDESFNQTIADRISSCSDTSKSLYEAMIDNMIDRNQGSITKVAIPTLLNTSGISYNDLLLGFRELRYFKLAKISFKYQGHTFLPDVLTYAINHCLEFERDDIKAYVAELSQWVGNDGTKAKKSKLVAKFGKK
jgi:hypothetical protein